MMTNNDDGDNDDNNDDGGDDDSVADADNGDDDNDDDRSGAPSPVQIGEKSHPEFEKVIDLFSQIHYRNMKANFQEEIDPEKFLPGEISTTLVGLVYVLHISTSRWRCQTLAECAKGMPTNPDCSSAPSKRARCAQGTVRTRVKSCAFLARPGNADSFFPFPSLPVQLPTYKMT